MIGKVGKCCQMWGIPSFSRGRGVGERGTPGKMLNIKAGNIIMLGQRMVSVQIFGLKNSPATRAAERFFKERRVTLHASEEHTSELQSPCNLVCRLLLEK